MNHFFGSLSDLTGSLGFRLEFCDASAGPYYGLYSYLHSASFRISSHEQYLHL